jgi:hypothetical protein
MKILKKCIFFSDIILFLFILLNNIYSQNTVYSLNFINEFVLSNLTVDLMINKYGYPDTIKEIIYNYDPNGKVVVLHYGKNEFHFYVNNDKEINLLQDIEIEENFYNYFPEFDKNKMGKEYIIGTFGHGNNEYDFNFSQECIICYWLNDSVLHFTFRNNMLINIGWSINR